MKNQPTTAFAILLMLTFSIKAGAQGTFSSVSQILLSNCASSSCHNTADVAAGLDFTASLNDVYSALINMVPLNQAAVAKGNKLVKPGYVNQSFLFRKIANGFDPIVSLDTTENSYMSAHQQLGNEDLEMIRQWIQFGAPQTDTVISRQLISNFYNGSGLPMISSPASPDDQGLEGMQLRIGPIMLVPGQEEEFFHKFKIDIDTEKEVYRMEAVIDNYSHHFVIYNFKPDVAATYPEGPQNAGSYEAQIPIHFGANELDAWNESRDDMLPSGTAYFWDPTTNVVLDYHVRNYSSTQILGATAYINVYTRDKQPTTREMKMEFAVYGGLNPFLLQIPPTGQPFKQEFVVTKSNEVWDIWKMQGHTHLLGTDFDIFLRNPDGTRGQQIYEGFYNADYTYNQGFFDNKHAPIRTTETPFVTVDMNNGLILEGTWVNSNSDTIGFGLTTKDEMFASYLSYTLSETPTAVEPVSDDTEISVFPNPVNDLLNVKILNRQENNILSNLYSSQGKLVYSEAISGEAFSLSVKDIPAGVYLLELIGNSAFRKKVIIQ